MSDKKPLIFYVDDEPRNLAVFEASMPEEWEIKTFDSGAEAIEALNDYQPALVLSDQRMPSMSGVQLLEIVRQLQPLAIRIIVTGYSDEDLVIESVRKAQVYDYIRKPWDVDELEASLRKALEFYEVSAEREGLVEELRSRENTLTEKNMELLKITGELKDKNLELFQSSAKLEKSHQMEAELRKELQCWVPPFVLWALEDKSIEFPIQRNLVGICFDIVDSSRIHGLSFMGRSLRSHVLQAFSEAILRHGGWRESHSGDSAYGHFGLLKDTEKPHEAALAVSREFRSGLKNLAEMSGERVECGLAIHPIKNTTVDVHEVMINTPRGGVKQKSFDTTSTDVDLLHRMEKLVHKLPGSNIILSKDFLDELGSRPDGLLELGSCTFKGQSKGTELFLIPSYYIKEQDIENLSREIASQAPPSKKVA